MVYSRSPHKQLKRSKRSNLHGFTLIELVLVIVILGVIASISLPKYQSTVIQAQTAELNTFAAAIRTGAAQNEVLYRAGQGAGFLVADTDVCNVTSVQRFISKPIPSNITVAGAYPVSSCEPGVVAPNYTAACAMYIFGAEGTTSVNFRIPCTQ